VEACDFLVEHGIEGRVLNTWNQGGYTAWVTERPVFMYSHGEVMGQDFYAEYVAGKEPGGFEVLLERWLPTVVLVPYESVPFWLYHLDRAPDWRMAHADATTAVFLHASEAKHVPALPAPVSEVDYPVFDDPTVMRIIDAAVTAEPAGFGAWLRGSAAWPVDETRQAAFWLQTGEVRACIGIALAGLERTPHLVPDLLLTLGHALNARRAHALADRCFEAFLRADDDPAIEREIHAVRKRRGG
jgi:hypothetical protein